MYYNFLYFGECLSNARLIKSFWFAHSAWGEKKTNLKWDF